MLGHILFLMLWGLSSETLGKEFHWSLEREVRFVDRTSSKLYLEFRHRFLQVHYFCFPEWSVFFLLVWIRGWITEGLGGRLFQKPEVLEISHTHTHTRICFGAIPRKILGHGEVYVADWVWDKHLQNVGRVSKVKWNLKSTHFTSY